MDKNWQSKSDNCASAPALPIWIAFAAFFTACFMRAYAAGDIWFLLLAGDYALTHGDVPRSNFFLYTWHDQKDLFGGWGYGLMMALAHRAFGLAGTLFFNAVLWSGVMLSALGASRFALGKPIVSRFLPHELVIMLCSASITFLAVVDRSWLRPEVTMYLCWMCGIALFEWARWRNKMAVAQMVFPLLVWLEAWFHTAGLILLLLPLAYAFEHLAATYRQRNSSFYAVRDEFLRWACCLTACLVLPCLNPYGAFQVYGQFILFLNNFSDTTSWLVQQVFDLADWQHLVPSGGMSEFLPTWHSSGHMLLFGLLLTLSIVIVTVSNRKIWSVTMLTPLAVLALLHIRGVGIFGLGIMVPLIVGSHDLLTRFSKRKILKEGWSKATFLSLLCLITIGFTAYGTGGLRLPTNEPPLPQATRALHGALPYGGNIFTTPYLGAIVAWSLGAQYKVPLSAHMMVIPPDVLEHYRTVIRGKPGWKEELQRHQVKAIVIEPVEKNAGAIAPLLLQILYNPEWRLVAVDKDALTFTQAEQGAEPIDDAKELEQAQQTWNLVLDNIQRYRLEQNEAAQKSKALAQHSLATINDTSMSQQQRVRKLAENNQ